MNSCNWVWGFSKSFLCILMLVGAIALNGCATVVMEQSASVNSVSIERDALKTAASDVATAKWPKPTSVSLGERLTGVVTKSRQKVTKKEAVAAYLTILTASEAPKEMLLEDTERHLQAADVLLQAASNTVDAVRLTMSDVAILEGSIAQLRQARDIYLATTQQYFENDTEQNLMRRRIKQDFNQRIAEIGQVADVLADRVAHDRTQTFAQPRSQSNFLGSL